jgi:exonuclease SbcC
MITKLTLRNFKKFHNLELNFSQGLNVIVGNNEAGKSTVLSALLATLFADAQTRSKQFLSGVSNWQSQSKEIFLELQLSAEDASYKLERDFAAHRQLLVNLKTKQAWQTPDLIARQLAGIGFLSEQSFKATALVQQAELARINFSADLRQQLQAVTAVNPNSDLEARLSDLRKELQQLRLGLDRPSKNPGQIKAAQDELAQLSKEVVELEAAAEQASLARAKGEQGSGDLGKIDKRIAEVEELLANNRKFEAGSKSLAVIESQLQSVTALLSGVQNSQMQLRQLESELKHYESFDKPSLEKDAETLTGIRQAQKANQEVLTELDAELGSLSKTPKLDYLSYSEQKSKSQVYTNTGVLMVGLAVGGVVLSLIIGGVLGQILQIVSLLLVIAGLATMAWGALNKTPKSATPEKPKSQTGALENQIAQLQQRIDADKKRMAELLASYGQQDFTEFFSRKARFNTLQQEHARATAAVEAKLAGRKLAELEAEQHKLVIQKAELEKAELTPEVKAAAMAPNDYLKARRELDMLVIERRRLEKESAVSEVRTADAADVADKLVQARERKVLIGERLAAFKRRAEVLDITITLLEQAITATSRSANAVVSAEVEKILPKLTNDRYRDLRLNDHYDIEVFSSDADAWIKPLGQLSLGTVDQIYLAARVALAKSIMGNKFKYLFLDDPFTNFDASRLASTREYISELAKEMQIFLFTHNPAYKEWGNAVELPGN